MGYVPRGVVELVLIVMFELPAPGAGIDGGLKVIVVPAGAPVAESAIALLKPPLTVVVIVDPPCPPSHTVSVLGEALTLKLPIACDVPITRFE